MGKATKLKQREREAKAPNFPAILSQSNKKEFDRLHNIVTFNPLMVIKGFEQYSIRPLKEFVPRTRSLNQNTRLRELIRYTFNKYPVPEFLYEVWNHPFGKSSCILGTLEDFRLWYIVIAQGKSLYKECTMGLLTKKETYHFSTCPFIMTIPQAIWYSIIRSFNDEITMAAARKIASTKISNCKVDEFWKGVARWFVTNDTSIQEINDLLDYISARHRDNKEWHLRDQTLKGLQRLMRAWHRELHRSSTMVRSYPKWNGINIPDSTIERGLGNKRIRWKFHQITTGKELAEEGNKQHHCVSSYASMCSSGKCSIWSLTQSLFGMQSTRTLTIEVRDKTIIQARGYANRLPKNPELDVLREWALKNTFKLML